MREGLRVASLTTPFESQRIGPHTMAASAQSPDFSSLIRSADQGDNAAAEALFGALYSELHRLAKRELARFGGNATLSATTLLHETYIELSGRSPSNFPDHARFMAYAARAMRGLIIDHARRRSAIKRGGQFEITSLASTEPAPSPAEPRELEHISDALDELSKQDHELAGLVDLKFFCGFSFAEIGAMRNVSERTVQRQWEKARIYLHRSIRADL
jgi:RNA polymerase sigma factor (TIGR02999 family)